MNNFEMIVMLFCLVTASTATQLAGSGSTVTAPVISDWGLTFSLMKPEVSISYNPVGSTLGIAELTLNNTDADFTPSEGPLTTVQFAASFPPNDFLQVPLLLTPIVLIYNLPYGDLMTNASKNLVLDRVTTAKIFNLEITTWNHPSVVALQDPDVGALLPNATIQIVVRKDSAIGTRNFRACLQSFYPSWPWGQANTWSAAYLSQPHVHTQQQNMGVAGQIIEWDTSIGYLPYNTVIGQAFFKTAVMINKNGDKVTLPDLTIAGTHAVWDSTFASNSFFDSSVPNAWPLGGVTYMLVRKSGFGARTCRDRTNLMLFLRWAVGSNVAKQRLSLLGFSPLDKSTADAVIAQLSTLTCDNENSLLYKALPQHNSNAYDAVLGLNAIIAAASIALVVYYIHRHWAALSLSAVIFYTLLLTGALSNYVAVGFFYAVPANTSVCQGRLWFAMLGFSMILSAIFCRGYQIRAVHKLTFAVNTQAVRHVCVQLSGNSLLVAIQLVYLLIWQLVDPFQNQRTEIDDLEMQFTWICRSQNVWAWWSVEVIFVMGLLGFGLFVVYKTWDMKHMVNESKWISISIYNTIAVLFVLLAFFASLNVNDDAVFWLAGCSTLFLTTVIMVALFVPKYFEAVPTITSDTSQSGPKRNSAPRKEDASMLSHRKSDVSSRTSSCKMGPGPVSRRPSADHSTGNSPVTNIRRCSFNAPPLDPLTEHNSNTGEEATNGKAAELPVEFSHPISPARSASTIATVPAAACPTLPVLSIPVDTPSAAHPSPRQASLSAAAPALDLPEMDCIQITVATNPPSQN